MFFKRKINLARIHKLYMTLQHCLPHQEEKLLINQIGNMLNMAEPGTLETSLIIMYPGINLSKQNGISALSLFVKGLRDNGFFDYVNFIKGLRGR